MTDLKKQRFRWFRMTGDEDSAWLMVEALNERGWNFRLRIWSRRMSQPGNRVEAAFFNLSHHYDAEADTVAEAIRLAAARVPESA